MKRHGSMNHIYRLVWSQVTRSWVAVAETARGRGKGGKARRKLVAAALALTAVAFTMPNALAGPSFVQTTAGTATVSQKGNVTTVKQTTSNATLTWNSFDVGANETVNFVQPSSTSIAVNDILGNSASQIFGHLNANGEVFLINPNGIVFGKGSEVNVGGLVASTLALTNAFTDEHPATLSFSGNGTGSIVNNGTIHAVQGGYVALIGNTVSNQGTITAQLGTIALGAGKAVTLNFNESKLVGLQVDQSVIDTLAENGGLIQADGGMVFMTAGAKEAVLASVVNNSGVIEARTVGAESGVIKLLGGMTNGTVNVGGTLDASAPNGGDGGKIETSAAQVKLANNLNVTTRAGKGATGSWLIDPDGFTIAASGGDETGAALSAALANNNITIASTSGSGSDGNVNVNDGVTWGANTLTLSATNNININAPMYGTGTAGLALLYGQGGSGGTYNINAPVNLANTGSFTTQLGSAPPVTYTIITSLGAQNSTSGTDLQGINGNLLGNYVLGSNIDASATSRANWNGGAGFTPIGNNTTAFSGVFDGLGHTISNLTINTPGASYVGLFGNTSGGTIQNVGLINASVSGQSYVGALVGSNSSTINNSYATGAVTAGAKGFFIGGLVGINYGAVNNSYATGAVTAGANGYSIGGLVGLNTGPVNSSYATGSVSGGANSIAIGGLVGANYGSVSTSYTTGSVTGGSSSSVIGGLVGKNFSMITNSYEAGAVIGGTSSTAIGGLVGKNYGISSGDSSDNFTNVYWNTTVNPSLNAIGNQSSFSQGGLTTAQMQNVSNFNGFNFSTTPGATGNNWVIVDADGSVNNAQGAAGATFPMLTSEYSTAISNTHQLQLMAMAPSANYILVNNINAANTGTAGADVWGTAGFVPIGNFNTQYSGTFDGLGHVISGLTINSSGDEVGLFGQTSTNAIIQNVGLVGGTVQGGNSVGALVGSNYGTVSNSYSKLAVSGTSDVGGLVGVNHAPPKPSLNTSLPVGATLSSGNINNSYATGTVSGDTDVGGLVGMSVGTISTSYATGYVTGTGSDVGGLVGRNFALQGGQLNTNTGATTVTAGSIMNSYATGAVSGASEVGGLAGGNYGTISASYATGVVSETLTLGPSPAIGGQSLTRFGGLVGVNAGTVEKSYATGAVSGDTYVGGLAGMNSGAIDTSYATGNVSGFGEYVGGLVGTSTIMHTLAAGSNSGTPPRITNSYATGAVIGVAVVGGLAGGNYGTISTSYATGTVSENLTSAQNGVQSYSGLLFIKFGGLVGANIGAIEKSYATGSVTGEAIIGGLVGSNYGAIDTSYAMGNITGSGNVVGGLVGMNTAATKQLSAASSGSGGSINNSYATGDVSGLSTVGGLVGWSFGTINESFATGNVTGTGNDIGGLVGKNSAAIFGTASLASGSPSAMVGNISNSYATGAVSGGSYVGGLVGDNLGAINNSYAAGAVHGSSNIGGLVGIDNTASTGSASVGVVTNSFWDADTTGIPYTPGQTVSGIGIGMSTANMKLLANFTTSTSANSEANPLWDFANTWVMYDNYTYPLLRAFMTPLTVTANDVTVTYTGTPYSGTGAGASYSTGVAPSSGLWGTLTYTINAQKNATDVGNYEIMPVGLYSNQQGYAIDFVPGTLKITSAASATGGGTGTGSATSTGSGSNASGGANTSNGAGTGTKPASSGEKNTGPAAGSSEHPFVEAVVLAQIAVPKVSTPPDTGETVVGLIPSTAGCTASGCDALVRTEQTFGTSDPESTSGHIPTQNQNSSVTDITGAEAVPVPPSTTRADPGEFSPKGNAAPASDADSDKSQECLQASASQPDSGRCQKATPKPEAQQSLFKTDEVGFGVIVPIH